MHWLWYCVHGQTHTHTPIGNVSSVSSLLSFSLSLFHSPQWNTLLLSMLDFHTIAVTECVNWEKCVNKWLIFLLLLLFIFIYFCFPPSICHPFDKFVTYTILWCQRIYDLFKNKVRERDKKDEIDFMRAGEAWGRRQFYFHRFQIFSLIGILFLI